MKKELLEIFETAQEREIAKKEEIEKIIAEGKKVRNWISPAKKTYTKVDWCNVPEVNEMMVQAQKMITSVIAFLHSRSGEHRLQVLLWEIYAMNNQKFKEAFFEGDGEKAQLILTKSAMKKWSEKNAKNIIMPDNGGLAMDILQTALFIMLDGEDKKFPAEKIQKLIGSATRSEIYAVGSQHGTVKVKTAVIETVCKVTEKNGKVRYIVEYTPEFKTVARYKLVSLENINEHYGENTPVEKIVDTPNKYITPQMLPESKELKENQLKAIKALYEKCSATQKSIVRALAEATETSKKARTLTNKQIAVAIKLCDSIDSPGISKHAEKVRYHREIIANMAKEMFPNGNMELFEIAVSNEEKKKINSGEFIAKKAKNPNEWNKGLTLYYTA